MNSVLNIYGQKKKLEKILVMSVGDSYKAAIQGNVYNIRNNYSYACCCAGEVHTLDRFFSCGRSTVILYTYYSRTAVQQKNSIKTNNINLFVYTLQCGFAKNRWVPIVYQSQQCYRIYYYISRDDEKKIGHSPSSVDFGGYLWS